MQMICDSSVALSTRFIAKQYISSEVQPRDSNECDTRKHSPFPRARRFRRLNNKTTTRTTNTTKRMDARDAVTITIVEKLSLSPLGPSTSGAEEVKVATENRKQ